MAQVATTMPVHAVAPVVMNAAMDVFGLFVIAIIIFNIVAPLLRSLARAIGGAANRGEAEARQRLDQSPQPSSPASASAAARAAELARLRRALLASAGVPESAGGDQSTMSAGAPTPAAAPTTPAASLSPLVTATQTPAATSQSGSALQRATRAVRQARRMAAQTIAAVAQPAAQQMMPADWSAQDQGSLLTLESAASAFDQRGLPTDANAATALPAGPAALSILQGADSGMNLFIAAAIVGPCAAFRPIGHTPGGW